jgi:type IV pilus assembly protein PilB
MLTPFLQYLIEKKIVPSDIAEQISGKIESGPKPLDFLLVEMAKIDETDLLKHKADFYHLPQAALQELAAEKSALEFFPKEAVNNYQMIPFEVKGEVVSVGMVNPENLKAREAIDFLARQKGWETKFYVVTSAGLKHMVDRFSGTLSSEVKEALVYADERKDKKEEEKAPQSEKELEEVVKSAPVSKMVSVILRHAVEGGASDIHIEPGDADSRVRYRIDGELHETLTLPKYIHASVVSRIKVVANLKIDETRKPQDGRIHMEIEGKKIDFRVSTLPLTGSEKVVMRILDVTRGAPKLETLGFMGRNMNVVKRQIEQPNGLFLVTGPTGSGKSTTLFSALSLLNKENVNIVTLEDPVEYYLAGANQSQVRAEVGYTFASGLRSILRQDPDIIMVGEIRDNETAQLAVQAALTGHIVLSTLHTNDAAGAIPRLLDMKVEPFLLSNTVNIVEAQRLVRKICEKCKAPHELPQDLLETATSILGTIPDDQLFEGVSRDKLQFFRGKGCGDCGNTGYKGRLSILEVVENTKSMKTIIANGFDHIKAEEELKKQGFISMLQDGIMKTLLGLTTVDEIVMATKE